MKKFLEFKFKVVALLMVIYHSIYIFYTIQDPNLHLVTHLMFGVVLCYLSFTLMAEERLMKVLLLLFALLGLVASGYVYIFYPQLKLRLFFNTNLDLLMGLILIILSIEACRRAYGLIIPAIVIGVVLYPFLGRILPEPFSTITYPLKKVLSNLSLTFNSGLWGAPLYTSAEYLYIFMVFSGVLQASGGLNFFIELGKIIGEKIKGGAAMMSVVSSAGVGTMTGSVVANITITGSFTIPTMKSIGYSPEEAAAIETAASNGGQIMPPVMGVLAFFMAGMTGIPYIKICAMALIPALLYYLNIGTYVYLRAEKKNIGTFSTEVDKKELLYSAPVMLTPFVVIIGLLWKGYSVSFSGLCGIISLLLMSSIRKKTRPTLKSLIDGFIQGSRSGAEIAVMTAIIGLLLSTFTMTGIGVKIGSGIESYSGGNIWAALIMVWGMAIVLGMVGIPIIAFIIGSMFIVPGLVKTGIPFEVANFFILFPCCFGGITPPVAMFAAVAAKLAKAKYSSTMIEATKIAWIGLLLPFMFIFNAPLLMDFHGNIIDDIVPIISSIVIILSAQISFVGYFSTTVSFKLRLLYGVIALINIIFLCIKIYPIFYISLALFFLLIFYQKYCRKKFTLILGK